MKKKLFLVSTIVMMMTLAGCLFDSKDDDASQTSQTESFGKVVLSCSPNASSESSKNILFSVLKDEVTELLVSIKKTNGEDVFSDKKINISKMPNGSYISDAITLETGNYQITAFGVLVGETLQYAVPAEGSTKASKVNDALPIYFTVSKDISTKVVPQVVLLDSTDDASDYGFVAFDFEIVELECFYVGSYIYDSSNYYLTSSHLIMRSAIDSTNVILEQDLTNIANNKIIFPVKIDSLITLTIEKNGYKTYKKKLHN